MFKTKKKLKREFLTEVRQRPKNLFERMVLLYDNGTLIQTIGFHVDANWDIHFEYLSEKEAKRTMKLLMMVDPVIKEMKEELEKELTPGFYIELSLEHNNDYYSIDINEKNVRTTFIKDIEVIYDETPEQENYYSMSSFSSVEEFCEFLVEQCTTFELRNTQ